jgi:ribosomal-protein-alanine N-acetyltransferase
MTDVDVDIPRSSDAADFVTAVHESRSLHQPWLDPPDTPARFDAYLERTARDDQAAYLIRHHLCGTLVGFVNVNNIVRGGLQSGFLGYGGFASHAGQGFMTRGLRAVLGIVFGDLGLHRVEANIQPANRRSINLARRLGFDKEGFSPAYLIVDGEWRDHERWALRAESWAAGRHASGG